MLGKSQKNAPGTADEVSRNHKTAEFYPGCWSSFLGLLMLVEGSDVGHILLELEGVAFTSFQPLIDEFSETCGTSGCGKRWALGEIT